MSLNVSLYREAKDLLLTAFCDAMPASHSQRVLKDKAAQLIGKENMHRLWQRMTSPVEASRIHSRINERARVKALKGAA